MTLDNVDSVPGLVDGKANFDAIYNADDPRAYYAELGELGYEIPHHGQPVFRRLLAAEQADRGLQTPQVLDLCCSYGVNAALMTCDLTMDDLIEHYRSPEIEDLSTAELLTVDDAYYSKHRHADAPDVYGLDISDRAVGYAQEIGLLQHGASENLEERAVSPALEEVVTHTDMITVTAGVGYITAKTFTHLLDAVDEPDVPWLAAFVLRQFSYHDIADVLAERGLVTERLVGRTFPQRRFSCDEEQEYTVRHLEESGLDVSGLEADGSFHTEFYLSRPASEVAERPLVDLLPNLVHAQSAADRESV